MKRFKNVLVGVDLAQGNAFSNTPIVFPMSYSRTRPYYGLIAIGRGAFRMLLKKGRYALRADHADDLVV